MPANLAQLRVEGLTTLQLAELQAAVAATGSEVTTIDAPDLGGDKVGEPALFTIVVTLGPSVIAAVGLWLAKQKKGRARKIRYTKVSADGSTESFVLDESSYDEGESPSKAIQSLLERKLGGDRPAAG